MDQSRDLDQSVSFGMFKWGYINAYFHVIVKVPRDSIAYIQRMAHAKSIYGGHFCRHDRPTTHRIPLKRVTAWRICQMFHNAHETVAQ